MAITNERTDLAKQPASFAATPFQTVFWLSTIEKTLKQKGDLILFKDKGKIIGSIPIFRRKMGITISFSPPPGTETAYGGISGERAEELYPLLKKEVKDFFIVHPGKVQVPGLLCKPKFTIITKLDAKDADEHFSRLKKGHRYNIRKAEKDNIIAIKEGYDKTTLRDYYSLLKTTYNYKGFEPAPFEFYEQVISNFHKEGSCRLLVAYSGKRPVGTICALIHDSTLYYWTGAFLRNPEITKLYPNDLLQWHIIRWGYERKIPLYDMLGGDIPGIRDFKLGFGGELVEYTKIFSSKRLYLLSKAYGKLGEGVKNMIRRG
jgi:hypothetical protein